MLKIAAAGVAFIVLSATPLAHAQVTSRGEAQRLSAADASAVTDARVNIIKAALQLTPDQEKYWPTVENAIRQRAKDRQARLADVAQTVGERSDSGPVEAMRDRNPVDFMHRRAAALAQRSADLNKLADAWQPLYQTLTPDQKRRMGFLAIFVVRDMRGRAEQRRIASDDDNED
jgi:LTXXQ motif family protein